MGCGVLLTFRKTLPLNNGHKSLEAAQAIFKVTLRPTTSRSVRLDDQMLITV
jgi:hypothetical protein